MICELGGEFVVYRYTTYWFDSRNIYEKLCSCRGAEAHYRQKLEYFDRGNRFW